MPVEVYEDSLELQVRPLEAVIPDSREEFGASYPFPPLRATNRQENRRFRTAVLENDYLRATFLPDLGGRLLSLLDKRTNSEAIPQGELRPTSDSVRHAGIPNGLQITLSGQDRRNSMGTVAYAAEPGDDQAGLWFSEVADALSWHAHWTLSDDEAQLRLEVRAYNRTLQDEPYSGGLLLWAPHSKLFWLETGLIAWDKAADSGLLIWEHDSVMQSPWLFMGQVSLNRAPGGFQLSPRQLDTYRLLVQPFGRLGMPVAATEGALMGLRGSSLSIRTANGLPQGKLVLLTNTGQTLEATADLNAGSTYEAELPQDVAEFALLDSYKGVKARYRMGDHLLEPSAEEPDVVVQESGAFDPDATERTLQSQTLHQSLKAPAHSALALHATRAGAFERAADELEQALLHNGEDHLNWWLKAAVQRQSGLSAEDQPELLNAHYLAPLEPVLRAESYLSQPLAADKEANPILKPLVDTPDSFVEVACLLLDAGLYQDANRWLDEALRHVDLAMLRYLQAFTLMQGSRMQADAASQVAAASALAFGPPFPWRKTEERALQSLVQVFPQDSVLARYAKLANPLALTQFG